MKTALMFFAIVLFFAFSANAQLVISGKVVSSVGGSPVGYASVYINNTSIGTVTDGNGKFSIQTDYRGNIDLVISHTAFEKKIIRLSRSQNLINLSIDLSPQTNVLNEVVISGGLNTGWKKWRNVFMDYFIGTSGFAKECTIKNPQVLTFHYNRLDNELKVTSQKTLVVENKALGYIYKIDLNEFYYSFATLKLKSDITVLFENMKPANADEQKHFIENRGIAYNDSKMHFIRSLYQKEIYKNGFNAVAVHLQPNLPKLRIKKMISDAIAQAYLQNKNINTVTLASIGGGSRDSVNLYDATLAEPDFVIKDTSSANLQDAVTIRPDETAVFKLSDTLLVQYADVHDRKIRTFDLLKQGDQLDVSSERDVNRRKSVHRLQYTLMMLSPGNQITIYPDGGYEGQLFTQGFMDNVKVSGLLPWDYRPPVETSAATSQEMTETEAGDDSRPPDSTIAKNTVAKLKEYFTAHFTEKAYLQTDRPYYAAGDTVYFKAYVTNSDNHHLSQLSKVLHVDLINEYNHIDQSIQLRLENGMTWGDFLLPDSVRKSGTYHIRAYTRLMENNTDQGCFEKSIPVTMVKYARVPESGESTHGTNVNDKIDLQFFPEGGELVTGIRSKVAFKAVGPNGMGVDVKGAIIDNRGNQVATFASRHLGMGYFYLNAEMSKTYKAELEFDGNKMTIDLPKPAEKGIVLSVNNDDTKKTTIKIDANEAFIGDNKHKNFTLIVYTTGKILPFAFRLDQPAVSLDVDKSSLSSGVARATLFSSTGEPIAERLFFVKGNDILNLTVSTDKVSYAKRELVKVNLSAKNKGLASNGHFSVSVVDQTQVPDVGNAGHTIMTDLLLTSDVKGFVEQPAYYFSSYPEAVDNLDILMLTQGYRRFEWAQVLDSSASGRLAFQPETSLSVDGTLKTPAGKPIANGKIVLMDGKDNLILDTATDANGNFRFDRLNISDSSTVLVSSRKNNNSTNVRLSVIPNDAPRLQLNGNIETAAVPQLAALFEQQKFNMLEQGKLISPINAIRLKSVEIKGHKPPEHVKIANSANLNGPDHSNFVLMGDQLINCMDLTCLFGKIPGTISRSGTLYLVTTGDRLGEYKGYPPPPIVFILDGMILGNQTDLFDAINVSDIYSMELLSSGSLKAIYGSNAPGGALIVTTKRGGERSTGPSLVSPGLVQFQMKGFYKARQFYSPVYDHQQNSDKQDLRATIYWNPELVTDRDGNLSFSFYNNDGQGACRVVVEGIDNQGNIGRAVYSYQTN